MITSDTIHVIAVIGVNIIHLRYVCDRLKPIA